MPVAGGGNEHLKQSFFALCMIIFCEAQSIAAGLKTADCFLEGFFVGLSDTHDFAYGAHLSSQSVLYVFKFLKSPAGEFDYNIVAVRDVLI